MEPQSKSPVEETKEEEVHYKLVPWMNWEEWNFVRESLFSSSPDSVNAALERILAWKVRGCLPTIIDVTASIIRIQQKDPVFRKDLNSDGLILEELQERYCIAIIRLVNGVVDQDRNKRGKRDERKLSLNEAADEIYLPRMLIDIRHEASHRDVPSLQLLREASVKALDWIQFYYWEPQKNAIPFQRDKADFVRKKMKSKLRELAFHLNAQKDYQLGVLPMKRKRTQLPDVIFGRLNQFSHKVKRLQESRGPKNQTTRIFRSFYQLYSSFPSEVVGVLLDFLLNALDSSGSDIEACDDSGADDISGTSKIQILELFLCKRVVTKLSSKEPELILIMLRAVLETLETHETAKSESGRDSLTRSRQTEQLSSLVLWLVENYDKVKQPSPIVYGGEIHDSSAATKIPKAALSALLRKCLVLSSPANNHLARSALLLAKIIGNNSVIDRLKKLSAICSPNFSPEESSSKTSIEHINQAEEMLELLKRRRNKNKAASTVESDVDVSKNDSNWNVVKSWNPCPIGMLPSYLGYTGVLPNLDKITSDPMLQIEPEANTLWELSCCDEKGYSGHDAEVLKEADVIEEEMVAGSCQTDEQDSPFDPFGGQLMIGGLYKKVIPEELLAIESDVRILV